MRLVDGLLVVGIILVIIGLAMAWRQQKGNDEIKWTKANQTVKGARKYSYERKEKRQGKVSLNGASQEELESLRGIGPALADRIIEYRQLNDGFRNIKEVMLVRGIGDKLFEKIKDEIEL